MTYSDIPPSGRPSPHIGGDTGHTHSEHKVTPAGRQIPDDQTTVEGSPIDRRTVSPSSATPALNGKAARQSQLLQSYQNQCRHAENLLGQSFLSRNLENLSDYLDGSHEEAEDLPFEVVYVTDEGVTSIIPPDENLLDDEELFQSLNDQLAEEVNVLRGHFGQQKIKAQLASDLTLSMLDVVHHEHLLADEGISQPDAALKESAVYLDFDRIGELPSVPGYTPESITETHHFKDIAEQLQPGVVLLPKVPEPVIPKTLEPPPTGFSTRALTPAEAWVHFTVDPDLPIQSESRKWTINQIRALDDKALEQQHDYIQLLFPNIDPSSVNTKAPLLTPQMVWEVQQNPVAQQQLQASLDQMLGFWGLARQGDSIQVDPGKGAAHRKWLLNNDDHNHKRITRVIKCLMACGYESCAANLERTLQEQRGQSNVPLNPYWADAVKVAKGKRLMTFSGSQLEARSSIRSYKDYMQTHALGACQNEPRVMFYKKGKPYFEFTNFYEPPGGINIEGFNWPTTEHYFQAKKFNKSRWPQIQQLKTAGDVFRYIHPDPNDTQKTIPLDVGHDDWLQSRDSIMLHALREKARQDDFFRRRLLGTGNQPLYEDSNKDSYWGIARGGENRLGAMLMQVRDEIRAGTILPIS
ncbi:NADAR domain-containing protein [Endozoicomonas arenosclerae]|uniref:NADAR domain-containing protein n=1 Tax=Endozoicomonas arenosclerae TaxID=1633495 RepID=UPI0009A192A6|nr:NADAR domain-containing protein [Endozoicomonas arenosclerae]